MTLADHEGRIQALETDNPEALRSLTDVAVTIAPTEDGKFLKYENATDKFVLGTSSLANLSDVDYSPAPIVGDVLKFDGVYWYPSVENPFPEVVDNQNYVRNVGVWNTLASTTEITTLSTDLGMA